MTYHSWWWGYGANAVGRYFPYDRETCDGCHHPIPRSQVPIYFEYRVFCEKCQGLRKKALDNPPLSDLLS